MKDHVYEILSGKKLINVFTHLRWWTAWAGAEQDAGKDGEVEEVESQESIEDLCTCCCHSYHFYFAIWNCKTPFSPCVFTAYQMSEVTSAA